jgi:hypothetical protein
MRRKIIQIKTLNYKKIKIKRKKIFNRKNRGKLLFQKKIRVNLRKKKKKKFLKLMKNKKQEKKKNKINNKITTWLKQFHSSRNNKKRI